MINIFPIPRQRALDIASILKNRAEIFAVGVTNETDDVFLSNISSGGVANVNWFHSPDFEGLEEIRDRVVQQTCLVQTIVPTSKATAVSFIEALIYSLSFYFRMHRN